MSRFRWYHFYFLLAAFDVVVILFILHLHQRTLESVEELLSSAGQLDEESRWLLSAQQSIIALNAPGNDSFRSEDYSTQEKRFHNAKRNWKITYGRAGAIRINAGELEHHVNGLIDAAEEIFEDFKKMSDASLSDEERLRIRIQAGKTMAKMDEQQHLALKSLGLLSLKNAGFREDLLKNHAAELEKRVTYDRYFISAVIIILVGVLAFGRRLQQADRALAEERRRVQEERKERLAAIGELCSSVAHGIKNPLAAIRSSAQLSLEMGKMDPDSLDRLRDIMHEGQRLGDRVTGLLSLARANAESFQKVNLNHILESAIRGVQPELSRRNLQISENIESDDLVVFGDQYQLEQVIIELVSNAMEHSERGDRIRISCCPPDEKGMATISVEDEGPGISEDVRSRVFDLFFTTKPSGTGIGLATVKRIIRLHGGTVELSSSSSSGAQFTISLPALSKSSNGNRRGLFNSMHRPELEETEHSKL